MHRLFSLRFLALAAVLAISLLSACSRGPVKRLYPPQVSVQEVAVLADGKLALKLRVQNFSTVAVQFSRIDATLRFGSTDAGKLGFDPAVNVGPGSAEVASVTIELDEAAAPLIAAALRERRALRYQLKGNIASSEPRADYDFEFESALNPVPGVDGLLR